MDFSPQQDRAMVAVNEWLRDPNSQLFRLFGYAGTGKTTLARHLAADVAGDVLFGAFTGKAAHVLKTKGCTGASTIHSMIYSPKDKSRERLRTLMEELEFAQSALASGEEDPAIATGERYQESLDDLRKKVVSLSAAIVKERKSVNSPSFTLNPDSPVREASLVVIDECSMVNEAMAHDLLSFGTKILVLGDPAQLPPVMGGGYFTEAKPDVMLTEIHRQAKDNPIIYLATKVRNQEPLTAGSYGTSKVCSTFSEKDMLGVDQVLTGRNKTRINCNVKLRALLEFTEQDPMPGDRVVCLRNNHEEGLLNGALFEVISTKTNRVDPTVKFMHLRSDDNPDFEVGVDSYMHLFRGQELPDNNRFGAEHFDYGYALTTHKAQGSQWSSVLVINESGCFRQDASRWLYTAITRAAESVQVVNP